MRNHPIVSISSAIAIMLTLFIYVTGSFAAEITLAWDPQESTHSNLSGYNLYYKAGSSVKANPNGAYVTYIPLSEAGFDPDHPSYTVTGLFDDTEYFFTITAVVEDEESGMSNEVSAINGASTLSTGPANPSAESGGSGGGCFIKTLK